MFKTAFASTVLAAAILIAPVAADAHGKRGHDHRQLIERSVILDTKLRNERLPLRRVLELGERFNGKKLRTVELEIRPRGRTTHFLLLGDGEVIGSAWSGRGDGYVVIEPFGRATLGRDFRRLQLAVEGSAKIERVTAQFEDERRRRGKKRGHRRYRDHASDRHSDWYFQWSYGPVRW